MNEVFGLHEDEYKQNANDANIFRFKTNHLNKDEDDNDSDDFAILVDDD